MATAELWRRTSSGDERLVARVVAAGPGPAVVHPERGENPDILAEMLAPGVPLEDGTRLTLADGEAFVLELPQMFRGSRFWASLVEPAE